MPRRIKITFLLEDVMKRIALYLLTGSALLFPISGNSAENIPVTPPPVRDVQDDFLPDMNFCSMAFQDISSKPII